MEQRPLTPQFDLYMLSEIPLPLFRGKKALNSEQHDRIGEYAIMQITSGDFMISRCDLYNPFLSRSYMIGEKRRVAIKNPF